MLSLFEFLEEGKFKFKRNYNLKELSSIKIGPKADIIVEPESIEGLTAIIAYLRRAGYNYKVIGGLTNTLFACRRYSGVIISTSSIRALSCEGNEIYAECGLRLAALMSYAERLGLGGYPGLCHIPGSVGAAIRGNAGAFGNEIADIFVEGQFLDRNGRIMRLACNDMRFGYRSSLLKSEPMILLSANFRFLKKPQEDIRAERERCLALRREAQPLGERSLGSIFMKADGISAGYYIDLAGLKGYRVGDAAVSTKHAGFIVNLGNATATDVLTLIEHIKGTVFSRFGVRLTEEIEIIG